MLCTYCGQPLTKTGGLYHCKYCNFDFKPGGKIGLLPKYQSFKKGFETKKPKSSELSEDEMKTFVYRVVERLTPLDGLDHDSRNRALKIRVQERQELIDVLNGTIKMTDWFTKARREANIQEYELVQILVESLEGLRGEEAKELKKQLEGVYRQFVRMRTISPTGA